MQIQNKGVSLRYRNLKQNIMTTFTTPEQMTANWENRELAAMFVEMYKYFVTNFVKNGFTVKQANEIAFTELVKNKGFEKVTIKAAEQC